MTSTDRWGPLSLPVLCLSRHCFADVCFKTIFRFQHSVPYLMRMIPKAGWGGGLVSFVCGKVDAAFHFSHASFICPLSFNFSPLSPNPCAFRLVGVASNVYTCNTITTMQYALWQFQHMKSLSLYVMCSVSCLHSFLNVQPIRVSNPCLFFFAYWETNKEKHINAVHSLVCMYQKKWQAFPVVWHSTWPL